MARILASVHLSLDGVMDAPERWCMPSWSAPLTVYADRQLRAARAVLLGRNTFTAMASWPAMAGEPFLTSLKAARIHVASTTLHTLDSGASLIERDVIGWVRRARVERRGTLLIYGSAQLIQALSEYALIDEYELFVHPVIVGHGKRLLPDGVVAPRLLLVDTRNFPAGVVLLSYEPADGG